MAQGPSDTILVAIRITLRIRESKVRNPDPPDQRRFVLSERRFLVVIIISSLLSVNVIEFKCSWNRVVTYPICRSVGPGSV